ncbi:MAG TPA: four helix bundle protein [Gemmatimonadales bacterium]
MAPYKNLKAWEYSQRLAVQCVKAARAFPPYEQDGLANQLRRAAYSVPLNIAEGSARKGSREYKRFLDIASGSLAELETILGISLELGYIAPADFSRLETLTIEASKTLFGLLRKVGSTAKRP